MNKQAQLDFFETADLEAAVTKNRLQSDAGLGLLDGLQGQSLGTCDLISVKGSDEGPLVVEVR